MSWSADGSADPMAAKLDSRLLLRAYASGLFPMADSHNAEDIFWVEPRRRGILTIDGFHLPRSLRKVLRQERFQHSHDLAFDAVVRNCAAFAPGREESWINAPIYQAYLRLFQDGHAHSIETWDHQGRLVGGLYGVRLGAAFFGESMFSRVTDASKAALAHLVARLRVGGFLLLDTQFLTSHLARFGGVEISRAAYATQLTQAIQRDADWQRLDALAGLGAPVADRMPAGRNPAVDYSLDFASSAMRVSELLLPPALLAGAGPSGKCIVQLLSQTS